MIDALGARLLCGFVKALTGARVRWLGCPPAATQRVYYANHASHGDFALLWACLPPDLRIRTRPVAGADYWGQAGIRRYVAEHLIHAVLIERSGATRSDNPIRPMVEAIEAGDSLIVFPEGTRVPPGEVWRFKLGGSIAAAETGMPMSSIYYKANLFDQAGMASLLPPAPPPVQCDYFPGSSCHLLPAGFRAIPCSGRA